ncbi:MAG TPA: hypothetical protein VMS17_04260 [Gemmataceae bacterium]|nr:hypothetical protein [Gemmataceae bacterium]
MKANWMSCVVMSVASTILMLGMGSKAKADVLNLNSVMQVAGPEIKGTGTYATGGALNTITMYVFDACNNQVSATLGIAVGGTDWGSTSTVTGGLPKGTYSVYAVMKTTLNGVVTTTQSGTLMITIK